MKARQPPIIDLMEKRMPHASNAGRHGHVELVLRTSSLGKTALIDTSIISSFKRGALIHPSCASKSEWTIKQLKRKEHFCDIDHLPAVLVFKILGVDSLILNSLPVK